MKILHIFDCAAVACILAKYQRKIGHDVQVLSYKGMDPFEFLTFYKEERLNTLNPTEFYLTAIDRAKDYDIIHVHFVWGVIPYLRNKYGDSKKIVLHYHGSDIRQFQEDKSREKAESMADYVIGSTKELCKYSERLEFISNPIDTDHFRSIHEGSGYLCIFNEDEELLRKHIDGLDIRPVYINRKITKIPYSDMPLLLNQFEYYIDIKFQDGKILPTDSKTGYEALACGRKVVGNDGEIYDKLPNRFQPEKIVKHIDQIYRSLN